MLPFTTLITLLQQKKSDNRRIRGKELEENKIQVLILGPKFVTTYNRKRPYIGIIQTTEICVLVLENDGHFKKIARRS